MCCIRVLSRLALRRLFRLRQAEDGSGVAARAELLASHDYHVVRALRMAIDRAWLAVEVILAGNELWEQTQLNWERSLEEEFYQPLRALCAAVPLDSLESVTFKARRQVWQELTAARQDRLLTGGLLDIRELLQRLPVPADGASEVDYSQHDWQELTCLADSIEEAGHGKLRPLFFLRYGADEPLLVVLVAALFRHAAETDPDCFGDLPQLWSEVDTEDRPQKLNELTVVLDRHRPRLDQLIREVYGSTPTVPQSRLDVDALTSLLQNGLTSFQRGDYRDAIVKLSEAIRLDPTVTAALSRRGDAYRLLGDYLLALADYDTVLRQEPDNTGVLFNRGRIHSLLAQHDEALNDYSAVLRIDPQNAASFEARGKTYADLGRWDEAIVDFSAAIQFGPNVPWPYHHRGEAYAAQGRTDLAIADYSQALERNEASVLSYLRRGDAYRLRGDVEEAVADYSNALRLDRFNVRAYLHRGIIYREQGRYEQAVADFNWTLELDPTNPDLFYQRGLLFRDRDEHSRALADFEKAVYLDAGNAERYFQRALTLMDLGELDQANEDLQLTLRLNPVHAPAHEHLGILCIARKEYDAALVNYETAIRLAPLNASAYVRRAEVLTKIGRFDEAIGDCDQALCYDPWLTNAYLVRGSARTRMKDYETALEDFKEVRRLNPDNAPAHHYIGLVYAKLGKEELALASLTEAVERDPSNAQVYANRAIVYQMCGQQAQSLDDLAQAVRFSPRYAAAYCFQRGQADAACGSYMQAAAHFALTLMLDPDNSAARKAYNKALDGSRLQLEKLKHSSAGASSLSGPRVIEPASVSVSPESLSTLARTSSPEPSVSVNDEVSLEEVVDEVSLEEVVDEVPVEEVVIVDRASTVVAKRNSAKQKLTDERPLLVSDDSISSAAPSENGQSAYLDSLTDFEFAESDDSNHADSESLSEPSTNGHEETSETTPVDSTTVNPTRLREILPQLLPPPPQQVPQKKTGGQLRRNAPEVSTADAVKSPKKSTAALPVSRSEPSSPRKEEKQPSDLADDSTTEKATPVTRSAPRGPWKWKKKLPATPVRGVNHPFGVNWRSSDTKDDDPNPWPRRVMLFSGGILGLWFLYYLGGVAWELYLGHTRIKEEDVVATAKVSADDLYRRFDVDPAGAQSEYVGQIIEVGGMAQNVEGSREDCSLWIYAQGARDKIRCKLISQPDMRQGTLLSSVDNQGRVRVKGRCTGKENGIVRLEDTWLLEARSR